jgi:hypothetical protein
MNAVIRVGDGRGFIVKDAGKARLGLRIERIVITAAHCLPDLPRCHPGSDPQERTYQALLGSLGQEPTVWAECLFADPIGDIAVLGAPDDQKLHVAYEKLVTAIGPLPIGDAAEESSARLLSLDGEWFGCRVQHINNGPLWIIDATKFIVGGMSGSPILADDGSAIGVVSVSSGRDTQHHIDGGPNPRLAYHLPARFLPRFRTKGLP